MVMNTLSWVLVSQVTSSCWRRRETTPATYHKSAEGQCVRCLGVADVSEKVYTHPFTAARPETVATGFGRAIELATSFNKADLSL